MPRGKNLQTSKKTKPESQNKKTASKTKAVDRIQYLKPIKSASERIPRKLGIYLLIFLALVLVVVRYKYLIVPITVNGKPILITSYLTKLQRIAGMEVTNQLITETLVNQKAEEQGININPDEINVEIDRIKEQFKIEKTEDLDAMLAQQGMTRDDLTQQISLNLKVQKLIADKIQVTDQEINDYYDKNKSLYKDMTEEQAKAQIQNELKTQKMQQEIGTWLEELRGSSKINVYLPGINVK